VGGDRRQGEEDDQRDQRIAAPAQASKEGSAPCRGEAPLAELAIANPPCGSDMGEWLVETFVHVFSNPD
jgi:hypothetical protein